MKILFAHSFFMAFDEKQAAIQAPYPPLGTLIAAACARREGYDVSLFDAMISDSTDQFATKLTTHKPDVVIFFEDNFNWLSKMCLQRMRAASQDMIRAAKSQGSLVIAAGSDASDEPKKYLGAGADYVIRGEAELRLLELLQHHRQTPETTFSGPGVARFEEGELRTEPPRRGEKNLSIFPDPAWDLADIDAYRNLWRQRHGYFSLNMVTTRGCPYGCNWCAKPIHGRRYDVRAPEDVAAEMTSLKKRFQPDQIWFADDIFGLKPGWIETFADEIDRLDGKIPFKIQARADLMSPDTVTALAKAGCETVWMGVESGSQKILDAMDKGLSRDAVDIAAERLHAAGIRPCFFLQFGYPGETSEDIRLTWNMVSTCRPAEIGISVAYPLPGTPFFERVKQSIGEKDHWEHSQDMRPIFKATYDAELYPELYTYIHQLFRKLRHEPGFGPRGLLERWRHYRTRRRLSQFQVEGLPFT